MDDTFSWNKAILVIYIVSTIYFITALFTNDPIKLYLSLGVSLSSYAYLLYVLWSRRKLKLLKGNCKIKMLDDKVICTYDSGVEYEMYWRDIMRISVNTVKSDEPLFASEVWLRLHSFPWRQVFSVPWRAEGFQEFYEKLSKYEGFDKSKVTDAMRSEKAVKFIVWERKV